MKKNKMMRLASSLLVAVLLTSSVISGTFAKYITKDDAEDHARVAKFGVIIDAKGSLFENGYTNAPETDKTTATVWSDSDDLVAPGTNNKDDAFTFEITGTPEVDVRVSVVVTPDKDVFLKEGTDYPDMTTSEPGDTFDVLTGGYYPVQYTLKKNGAVYNDGSDDIEDVTLAELKTVLEGLSTVYEAGTDLSGFGNFEITWKWDFGTTTPGGIDYVEKCDTLLGNFAAIPSNAELNSYVNGTDYNLQTGLKIEITVEQID